jgi:hypothetical protein
MRESSWFNAPCMYSSITAGSTCPFVVATTRNQEYCTFCNTVVTFRKLVEYDVLVGVRVYEYL